MVEAQSTCCSAMLNHVWLKNYLGFLEAWKKGVGRQMKKKKEEEDGEQEIEGPLGREV